MRRLPETLTLLALTLGALPAAAQWGVSLELGVARFGGTSRDSSGATVGPYRSTTFGLRLDRAVGVARVALGVVYAKTGLAAEGQGVASGPGSSPGRVLCAGLDRPTESRYVGEWHASL